MKVTISLPEKILRALDLYCRDNDVPRSTMIAKALEERLLESNHLERPLKYYERDKRYHRIQHKRQE